MRGNVRSIFTQIVIVIALASIMSLLTDDYNFVSTFNIIWMIGIPIGVGIIFNKRHRFTMSSVLVGCSLAAQMIISAYLGLGY